MMAPCVLVVFLPIMQAVRHAEARDDILKHVIGVGDNSSGPITIHNYALAAPEKVPPMTLPKFKSGTCQLWDVGTMRYRECTNSNADCNLYACRKPGCSSSCTAEQLYCNASGDDIDGWTSNLFTCQFFSGVLQNTLMMNLFRHWGSRTGVPKPDFSTMSDCEKLDAFFGTSDEITSNCKTTCCTADHCDPDEDWYLGQDDSTWAPDCTFFNSLVSQTKMPCNQSLQGMTSDAHADPDIPNKIDTIISQCGGSCACYAGCVDGIQNNNETGVDCGGDCRRCA